MDNPVINLSPSDMAADRISTVRDVLEFLTFAACHFGRDMDPNPGIREWNGLFLILNACADTLPAEKQSAAE